MTSCLTLLECAMPCHIYIYIYIYIYICLWNPHNAAVLFQWCHHVIDYLCNRTILFGQSSMPANDFSLQWNIMLCLHDEAHDGQTTLNHRAYIVNKSFSIQYIYHGLYYSFIEANSHSKAVCPCHQPQSLQ